MAKRKALDLPKIEQLIANWNDEKPNARNELIDYIEPWFYDFSDIAFFENKRVINTPMKIFNSPKDLAQEVAKKLLEKFPMPELELFDHKTFNGLDDLITYIRVIMFAEVDARVKKLTNNKNSLSEHDRIYTIPKNEMGESMEDYDLFFSFAKLYKELAVKYRKKLLAYDLRVFYGHSLDEISLIMGISNSTAKNYIKHIELKVLDRLKV